MIPQTVTPSVSSLYEPIQNELEAVKASILQITRPDSQLLADSIAYSLGGGGKYLRPAVTLLCGKAMPKTLSSNQEQQLIEVAAVSEMIHIATLLHDDVLDDAAVRRGRQTTRLGFGNAVSILSGDYLLAHASLKLAKVGDIRLVAIYSQVLADLCDGEVEQIRCSYNINTSWESYYNKSICKTASLFSAGCHSAGILAGCTEAELSKLKQFGRAFGIAFQVVDDLLDYTSTTETLGKAVFDDLKNGLVNAPILLALESPALTASEKEALRANILTLFENPQAEMETAAIESIRDALAQTNALEKTRTLAEEYIQEALSSLDFMPDSIEKRHLLSLTQSSLQRQK